MGKEKLTIYDDSYFKEVTIQDLEEGRIGILFETYRNIPHKASKYNILTEELDLLIRENKLIVETAHSLYQNISEHDQTICFALSKSIEYDVTTVCRRRSRERRVRIPLLRFREWSSTCFPFRRW